MSLDYSPQQHLTAFVQAFIRPELQPRYLGKLTNAKTRASFLDRLNHKFIDDLDRRFIVDAPKPNFRSASACYVISNERKFDHQLVTQDVADDFRLQAQFGMVVSYLPGQLAVYQMEAPARTVWLRRS